MLNPIENMPLQEMTRAIFQRLDGNLKKLDGMTVIPVYDAFPETLADRWDYVELAGAEVDPEPSRSGLSVYRYVRIFNVLSIYNGDRELESVIQQLNSYLASRLTLTDFIDLGSAFERVRWEKLVLEENLVARRAQYRRRWIVSDSKR